MFELARFYTRAETVGDLYQRYSSAAQIHVWPHLNKGPEAFWNPDGTLRFETEAHVQRLRDFRTWQGNQTRRAVALRQRLKLASEQ